MTEALAVITEDEQYQPGTPSMSSAPGTCTGTTEKAPTIAKHPQGFPKNIERMFETFHQTPSGEFKPTFYNPFEIKHRRRTSRDQFQVLESSFQENSKPNATVRRALAQRLGMTPRAVQVWFQNRRAKLKTSTCANPHSEMSEAPESPQIPSADASTQCSSLASPDHMASAKPAKVAKKGLGRRHSMPNMAQPAPIITNEHFKQLHEAIFGGHMMTPHLSQPQQQNLNYQVPMKPLHPSQSYDQGYVSVPPSYYPPGFLPSGQHMHSPQVQKTRAPSMAYGNPMMGLENPNMDPSDSPMANDLDYFLQSIIIPQGAQQQQQQMFLSSLMQSDPAQIPGITENLASFLCGTAPSGHGEPVAASANQQHNDSYLLSKYMNDERFAD